jgi:hypothetical protein
MASNDQSCRSTTPSGRCISGLLRIAARRQPEPPPALAARGRRLNGVSANRPAHPFSLPLGYVCALFFRRERRAIDLPADRFDPGVDFASPYFTNFDATATAEDGAGNMLVASSSETLHHVAAHHDVPNGLFSPAATPRNLDMDAAPDATPAMPDAPAAHDLNPMPALGDTLSLPGVMDLHGLDMAAGFADGCFPPMDLAFAPPTISDSRLTAFARLRFDDGDYYMHTYQIILGRNVDLAHRDMRRLAKADRLTAQGHSQAAENLLNGKKAKERKRHAARSVISEKGGIVSAPIQSMPFAYQQRRQSNASRSLSSASHPTGDSAEEKPAERAPQDIIMQAFPEVPTQFDRHVTENPNDCPLVPIHPQHVIARSGTHGPKGISREHAKIFYDYDQGHFCVEVLGSNGLYHEDNFLSSGQVVPLDHGDRLVIGAVNVQFYLPDVALTDGQRHRQDSGSRPMSFSFENGHGELETDEQISSESEGDLSVNPRHVYHYPIDSSLESEDADGDDDMDVYEEPVAKSSQKLKIKLHNPYVHGLKWPRSISIVAELTNNSPAPLPHKHKHKHLKKAHKRKHRDVTPEERPIKKIKTKHRESAKEPVKESKAPKEPKVSKESKAVKEPKPTKDSKALKEPKPSKDVKEVKEVNEPKEPKVKGKAPAKTASKTPVEEEPMAEMPKETPAKIKTESNKPPPTDSPPLIRKPHEGEMEAGEIEGLITEEMAREHKLPESLIGQVVEKRKGPGRPPKDGIMSKRQRSQLIKQAKEIERAKAAGIDPADIPMPSMKPKIVKRKDSNAVEGDEGDIRETTEIGEGMANKQMKAMRPPRTPSPEARESDYTEEQLQRPPSNYVVLIHEAISSSPTGQMNLQQIYSYIEKKYPFYKFKVGTNGWQSSVRHNLGQHEAFGKGDKEGKGFNWLINPAVSIEKERRKRQISPPVNPTQRQPYYAPNGYQAPYPPPGYPYHPGLPPHAIPPAAPRLPPSLANAQPRLPPSMTRDANATASSAPQNAPRPSPYASPWAGGNAAGSPPAPTPAQPYPQPNSQAPPVSSTPGGSGQYGVLVATSVQQTYNGLPATASPYSGPYGNAGASPYGQGPPRPFPSYSQSGQQQTGPSGHPSQSPAPPQSPRPPQSAVSVPPASQSLTHSPAPPNPAAPLQQPQPQTRTVKETNEDIENRHLFPPNTNSHVVTQLSAFREVYLRTRIEPGEEGKVDNAIRAYVGAYPESKLNDKERFLLESISGIEGLNDHRLGKIATKQETGNQAPSPSGTPAHQHYSQQQYPPQQHPSKPYPPHQYAPQQSASPYDRPAQVASPYATSPHTFMPNMMGRHAAPPNAAPTPAASGAPSSVPPSHRPSVEPLTPVPGSPAAQTTTPLRRSLAEINADADAGAEQLSKLGGGEQLLKLEADEPSVQPDGSPMKTE